MKYIKTYKLFESRHDFELYDMDELSNLKDTAGEINILIYFSKNSY